MTIPTGQNPGREAPPGLSWGDLIAALIEAHGTVTAVAWRLIEHADGDDVASVERALRRLRTRGQHDGGVWGQRVLRVFGVPASIADRVRWMGLYHSPFNDLPVALCLDQIRIWDRPPIADSRARIWLYLGRASCALRTRRLDDAELHLARARAALAAPVADDACAQLELALVEGFAASRRGAPDAVAAALARAGALLADPTLSSHDRACFAARHADQLAYQLNRDGDHEAALALYEALPAADHHPFASYRRDAGRAFGWFRLGRPEEAHAFARRACDHAGDGGYVRLRAMGLLLLARIEGAAGKATRARARAIAIRLGDDELLARVDHQERGAPVISGDADPRP